jgi:hypothetical protein
MRLDHLAYVAGPAGLATCVQRLGAHLGAAFRDGGLHPRFGTRNFVLPLRSGCYLEVIGVLDHPAADTAPFGRLVQARQAAGGGWLGWAVRVPDISTVEQRLGRPSAEGHRRRPDGFDLRWRQLGVDTLAVEPDHPFFVQWETDAAHHPSADDAAVALTGLEIAGDQQTVEAYLDPSSSHPLDGIEVTWCAPTDEERGVVAAIFQTATGTVRIN